MNSFSDQLIDQDKSFATLCKSLLECVEIYDKTLAENEFTYYQPKSNHYLHL